MPSRVKLVEVGSHNWRALAAIAPKPDQAKWVAPVTYYLCLALYGGEWHPLGVEVDGEIVGHLMWAVDEADDSVWLGGLVIDAASQGRGIGRAAVVAFLHRFGEEGRVNVALSYAPDNLAARSLYARLGFSETGEVEDGEIVARYVQMG
ncbi:MAG: GNAT family N-acetyltransferase [Gemmatimonadales bacterium]|nr:GNAT family N-acetyltransferase [Gemmatimonadales bacterium]